MKFHYVFPGFYNLPAGFTTCLVSFKPIEGITTWQ